MAVVLVAWPRARCAQPPRSPGHGLRRRLCATGSARAMSCPRPSSTMTGRSPRARGSCRAAGQGSSRSRGSARLGSRLLQRVPGAGTDTRGAERAAGTPPARARRCAVRPPGGGGRLPGLDRSRLSAGLRRSPCAI